MDFLLYLTPIGQEIISNIPSHKVEVLENSQLCKKYTELFGYTQPSKFVVCTDNIKNKISPVSFYVNETVYHEAVHIAQSCKGEALGVENPLLESRKQKDVNNSLKYNKGAYTYEVEAYYLEDKPELVLSYLKKYCF